MRESNEGTRSQVSHINCIAGEGLTRSLKSFSTVPLISFCSTAHKRKPYLEMQSDVNEASFICTKRSACLHSAENILTVCTAATRNPKHAASDSSTIPYNNITPLKRKCQCLLLGFYATDQHIWCIILKGE